MTQTLVRGTLDDWLTECLPDDAGALCSSRVSISVTHLSASLPPFKVHQNLSTLQLWLPPSNLNPSILVATLQLQPSALIQNPEIQDPYHQL